MNVINNISVSYSDPMDRKIELPYKQLLDFIRPGSSVGRAQH